VKNLVLSEIIYLFSPLRVQSKVSEMTPWQICLFIGDTDFYRSYVLYPQDDLDWGKMSRKKGKKITTGAKVSFYVPYRWHTVMAKIADENATTLAEVYRWAVKEYVDKRLEKPNRADEA